MSINDIKMKPKLTVAFLLAGLLPLIGIAWYSLEKAAESLEAKAFQQLEVVRDARAEQLKTYLAGLERGCQASKQRPDVIAAR